MTVTSVKLLNPIDPAKAQTLVRLATLAERLGVPMLMVGAYAYLVPYVPHKDGIFLKTIIPSRKATKQYLERP
ncbi:MAG: hypothetical protein WCS52_01005 [bacterium]